MMKKKILLVVLAFTMILSSISLVSCGDKTEKVPDNIVNGGFEKAVDNIDGWKKTGTAFSSRGVVDTKNDYKVGKNYFNGLEAGNQQFKGTLTSDKFKFDGEAISFKIGGGKNTAKIYVEIFEDGNSKAIAKVGNTAYSEPNIITELVRDVVKIPSAYRGKTLYIKVTDEDASDDMAYVLLDDFTILKTEASVAAALEERNALIEELNPAFTEDKTSKNIVNGGFEEGFKGWKALTGAALNKKRIAPNSAKFWTVRDFNAVGNNFFDGYADGEGQYDGSASVEAAIGTMRSTMFTLGGDGFISFMIGGSASPNCYVELCNEAGETLTYVNAASTDAAKPIMVTNEAFNDPNLALNMHRVYIDASSHKGKVMYIHVVDNAPNGPFGAITVDDFKVSMTETEVKELIKSTYESAVALPSNTVNDYLKKHYRDYEYPFALEVLVFSKNIAGKAIKVNPSANLTSYLSEAKAKYGATIVPTENITITKVTKGDIVITTGFDAVNMNAAGQYVVEYKVDYNNMTEKAEFIVDVTDANSLANGGFETGDLAGWEILTPDTLKNTAINGDAKHWGEDIPLNQSGNYHFDGWAAQYAEADAYSLKSGKFTLNGSGYISFKMGGANAVLKVFKADGAQVAEYKNTAFADVEFPYVDRGCRLATMTTFLADLSIYKTQELYIELHDIGAGGWGVAFFDEIITNYALAPTLSESKDTVQLRARINNPNYDATDKESKEFIQSTEFSDYQIDWMQAVNDYAKISVMAKDKALVAGSAGLSSYDVTTLIASVEAVYPSGVGTGIEKKIVKIIKPDETEATIGFDSFDLTNAGTYKVFYEVKIVGMDKILSALFNIVVA